VCRIFALGDPPSDKLSRYNGDKPALFISPVFVVFLDLFKMFAAIPSAIQHAHQFVILGSGCRTAKMQVGERRGKPLCPIQGLFEFCVSFCRSTVDSRVRPCTTVYRSQMT
jgi:hypothetical protein